jgi:hypothetical protein
MANEFTWAPHLEKILWEIARAAKKPTKKRRFWTDPLPDDAPVIRKKPADSQWSGANDDGENALRKREAEQRKQLEASIANVRLRIENARQRIEKLEKILSAESAHRMSLNGKSHEH